MSLTIMLLTLPRRVHARLTSPMIGLIMLGRSLPPSLRNSLLVLPFIGWLLHGFLSRQVRYVLLKRQTFIAKYLPVQRYRPRVTPLCHYTSLRGDMLALRKRVCLIKDETLRTFPTDLVGKLYIEFDPQDPEATIPDEISKWLA